MSEGRAVVVKFLGFPLEVRTEIMQAVNARAGMQMDAGRITRQSELNVFLWNELDREVLRRGEDGAIK